MATKRKQGILLNYFEKKPKIDCSVVKTNDSDGIINANSCDVDVASSTSSETTKSNYQDESNSVVINNVHVHDIALLKKQASDSDEKLDVMNKLWKPESNFKFPVTCVSNHSRSFQYIWFEKFTWLAYSEIENSTYCKYCVFFAPSNVGKSKSETPGQLVLQGYNNWKKAIEKFKNHQNSQYHVKAVMTYESLLSIRNAKSVSIDQQIDVGRKSQAEINRKRLEPIIKTVILCGRQNIPLRGHRDYGEFSLEENPSTNEGNFRALLRSRIDAGDENLIQHFKHSAKNATYISWNIQNQIINSCNEIILSRLVKKINSAKCFSILADETCDIATIEHLSLCVRYIDEEDDNKICEQFLQFIHVTSTTGKNISDKIVESLNNYGIDLSYLRGQGYDGAASMSGKFNGVQAHISTIYPQALYVHCASHSLNLAIGNSVTVTYIRNCIGIIEKVCNFFNSPKRQNVLIENINKHAPDTRRQKLRQVCPTRWVERHEAIMTMVELYDAVIYSLETIISWEDKDTSSKAAILNNSLCEFGFLVSLFALQSIFSYTLPLSKLLQKSDSELLTALHFVDDVVTKLNTLRNTPNESFKAIYEQAVRKAENFDISIRKPRTVSKQTLRSNIPADTIEDYFRRTIFIPFIDHVITQLHERFTEHQNLLKRFFTLLPSGRDELNEVSMQDFHELCEFYANDLFSTNAAILDAELMLWHQKFKNGATAPCENAIDAMSQCNKLIYPNIYNLLKIFTTLPVTTCVNERSFSTLRILKTYLRSTMTQSRLNGLALLYIHRQMDLSTADVFEELCKKKRKLDFIL